MKKSRKFLALLLAGVMLLSASACGGSGAAESEAASQPAASEAASEAPA